MVQSNVEKKSVSRIFTIMISVMTCIILGLTIDVNTEFESFTFIILLVILTIILYLFERICIKQKNIIQPITIINILIFIMFVVRPFILYFSSNYSQLINNSNSLRVYSLINNITSFNQLPHIQTIVLIIVGTTFINWGYFFKNKRNFIEPKEEFDYSVVPIKFTSIIILLTVSLISIVMFFLKYDYNVLISNAGRFALAGISFGTIDILWAYVLPFTIIFYYMYTLKYSKNKFFLCILIVMYMVLLMCISRRYFIVNLLVYLFVFIYYKNRKFKFSYILIILFMFSSIMIFAGIRNNNIGKEADDNILIALLDEFDMYDMLVCSQNSIINGSINFYKGTNYLSFPIIPKSIWANKPLYFDVEHTSILLNNNIKGGIPTSIIGSLFLNFNIIGVIIGGFLFGIIIKYFYNKIYPIKNIKDLFLFVIFLTFCYDIVRVGDITREIWTAIVYTIVFYACYYLIYREVKNDTDINVNI